MPLTKFPKVVSRQLFDDDKPNGYLESLNDWVDNNTEAVDWFSENHKELRKRWNMGVDMVKYKEALKTTVDVLEHARWFYNGGASLENFDIAINRAKTVLSKL